MRIPLLILCLSLGAGHASAAAPPEARRSEFRAALEQAERGPALAPTTRRALLDHPLYPWLEYAELKRELAKAGAADVRDLLARHAGLPFADPLRARWLHELARRRDWVQFRQFAAESPGLVEADLELRCHALQARLAGSNDPALLADIAATWLSGGSLPKACDGPFAALQAAGGIDAELRWQRLLLAAEAGNPALMRYVARGLPATQRQQAEAYARFIESPSAQAAQWPRDDRSRQVATLGLRRLARSDTDRAEALLAAVAAPLALEPAQLGQVQAAVALWSAASYEPGSAGRFAAVPASSYDGQLHEWRAREALSRSDHRAVLAAIEAMPAELRHDPRWRYLEARMHELLGSSEAARTQFVALAAEPNYFGFLAADKIGADYALCPIEPPADAALRDALRQHAGLQRALELHALDRKQWALLEWQSAVPSLDDAQRRAAVAMAVDAGWTDRAVFSLASGDDQRVYELRFPLAHARHLRREASDRGLDPAWIAALIRAESAWQPHARSHANARGLMQLLPGTGAEVARRHGEPWHGPSSLYQPQTNITLGTAHLAELLQKYGNAVHAATAAYNAGPTPVARWLSQRASMPADLWIETIPYRETREYVARILAFSAIYDWRFGGRAVPISERMLGRTGSELAVREFVCPVDTATTAVDEPEEAGSAPAASTAQ